MARTKRDRRAPARPTLALIGLVLISITLFAVLLPVHVVLYGTPFLVAMPLAVALCGAPLATRAYPRLAITVFCLAAINLPLVVSRELAAAWPWPWSVPAMLVFIVFVFVITVRHGWRFGLVPLIICITTTTLFGIRDAASANALEPSEAHGMFEATADLIVTTSLVTAAFLVASLLHARRRVAEELTKERELSAAEQARRVLIEERTRIARELHDVIAHSMSVIQVQASTARYRIPDVSTGAATEFEEIAAVARGSLTEMRRLLGVLRTEDHTPELTPQQGLADIPALVDNIRRAGAEVSLSFTAPAAELSPSVEITAYRVVQEALSNAVRHAPGAPIKVVLEEQNAAIVIRVHNEPPNGSGATPPAGASHGLRGMQERVALHEGSLMVGPNLAGGWTVTAVLPWAETDEEQP